MSVQNLFQNVFYKKNILNYDFSMKYMEEYENKFMFFMYSHYIMLFFLLMFMMLLGIVFKNKAKHIKILNLMSAFYLFEYIYLFPLNYSYNFIDLNLSFNKNTTMFMNFFMMIATMTLMVYFLGMSNIFFLKENMKIEFTFLIWFMYLSSIFLITSTDFISIIMLLECISFSSYILVGFERKNKFSTTSALKYLILASIPGGFFILGLSLLYNNYGSFSQEYILLLLEILMTPNWFMTSVMDFNYDEMFENIDYMFFKTYNMNYFHTAIFAQDQLFCDYLINLNNFLEKVTPTIPFDIYVLELLFFKPSEGYCCYFTNSELCLLEKYYKTLWLQYLTVISELHMLQNIWINLNMTTFLLKDKIFYILYENSLTYILNWFSLLSFSLFWQQVFFYESTQNLMSSGIFGVDDFQIANFMKLMDQVNFHMELVNFENYELYNILNDKMFYSEYIFYENMSFTENFFLNTDMMYITMNNWNGVFNQYYPEFNTDTYWYFDLVRFNFYYLNVSLMMYLILIFMLINLSFKMTAAPFHFWAPSVYGGSPLATMTFLSMYSKLTIIFFMIWLFCNMFDSLKDIWQMVFFFLAMLSIIYSILGAFSEKIFKRFFVYSSTGHVGFMLIGIFVLNIDGLKATIDYLILYIMSSLLIWFMIMHLSSKTTTLINLKGLSFNQTFLSLIFSIMIFSLSGIPPLGGFFVKYEMFYSLMNSSFFFLAYFLLILTIISFFYYLRLIKIIFFENNNIFMKNKNMNDIKLRIISLIFFVIPFFMMYIDNVLSFFFKEILLNSLF